MRSDIGTILISVLVMASTMLKGQHLDTLMSKFQKHREAAWQEKLYAHLDQSLYLTGETLWFKVYSIDGTLHRRSDASKVAYVELLDNSDFPVLQAKIALSEGVGSGSFFLPASLNSGSYRFRVYTNWMKNFAPEFYFHQTITVVNPFVIPPAKSALSSSPDELHFFPEGGHLVADIQSKVGFSFSDQKASASIIEEGKDTVAVIRPGKWGMGNFSFTPAKGKKYIATVEHGKGGIRRYELPPIKEAGYVMQVSDRGDRIEVTVNARGVEDHEIYLFVHARQIIAKADRQMLIGQMTRFVIKKNNLPEGISHCSARYRKIIR